MLERKIINFRERLRMITIKIESDGNNFIHVVVVDMSVNKIPRQVAYWWIGSVLSCLSHLISNHLKSCLLSNTHLLSSTLLRSSRTLTWLASAVWILMHSTRTESDTIYAVKSGTYDPVRTEKGIGSHHCCRTHDWTEMSHHTFILENDCWRQHNVYRSIFIRYASSTLRSGVSIWPQQCTLQLRWYAAHVVMWCDMIWWITAC